MTQVLTDTEIVAEWNGQPRETRLGMNQVVPFARAVEAAVLAKRPKPIYEAWMGDALTRQKILELEGAGYVVVSVMTKPVTRPKDDLTFPCAEKCVTEREARKRERAAWEQGRISEGRFANGASSADVWADRDRLYPLPTVKRPRTVALSDGTLVTKCENLGLWNIRPASGVGGVSNAYVFGYALTPADARLLADLVESPYEEVPDDA